MNSKDRSYWYPLIVESQCEYCKGCGKSLFKPHHSTLPAWVTKILYIDHIDNDPNHNKLPNFQFLCPACNRIKNPKREDPIPERPFTPEMAKNTKLENPWRRWVQKEIIENGGLAWVDAVDGGAEKFGLSPETSRKYARKIVSSNGDYGMFQDSIVFKKDIPILEEELQKKTEQTDNMRKKLIDYSRSGKPTE